MMDPVGFISKLLAVYGIKHESEAREKEWTLAMVRELRGYASEVLEGAASRIIATRTDRRFPLPSECKQACDDVRKAMRADSMKSTLSMGSAVAHAQNMDWTEERLKLATDLMHCEMGREAAKNGWIGILHSFARKNARLPKGAEIEACKREAKAFDQAYSKCVRGGWPQAKRLEEIGAEMLRRRHELERLVLGRR